MRLTNDQDQTLLLIHTYYVVIEFAIDPGQLLFTQKSFKTRQGIPKIFKTTIG